MTISLKQTLSRAAAVAVVGVGLAAASEAKAEQETYVCNSTGENLLVQFGYVKNDDRGTHLTSPPQLISAGDCKGMTLLDASTQYSVYARGYTRGLGGIWPANGTTTFCSPSFPTTSSTDSTVCNNPNSGTRETYGRMPKNQHGVNVFVFSRG